MRQKVSERERLSIESGYHDFGTGELEKEAQVYDLWRHTHARDHTLAASLGIIYEMLGKYVKALEQHRQAVHSDTGGDNHVGRDLDYIFLNQLDEAQAAVKQAQGASSRGEHLLLVKYYLGFLKQRW